MTTRRSTKTTTRRAERKCSSSSSSSAFCDVCVYIIKSLTEVLFNNNRGNSVTKQISLVVLSRPSVRSRGQRSKNLKPEIAQIYIRSLSFASKSDWLIVFQLIRHFSAKSASNLNQNILLLCISYITEEISDKGRGQKMSTRHLDYDPDRRARESGREEAEVLDARRLVYVEPWYRKLWRWIHFF